MTKEEKKKKWLRKKLTEKERNVILKRNRKRKDYDQFYNT
jgi:hypothetical protein